MLSSCSAHKVSRAEKFYANWLSESTPISQTEYENLGVLYQKVYDVYEVLLKDYFQHGPSRNWPNLKYFVIDATVSVSVCDSIMKKDDWTYTGRVRYDPVNLGERFLYNLKPRPHNITYQPLYYNDKYKEIIRERDKFSTPSVYGFQNDKRAFARFSGRWFYKPKLFHVSQKMRYYEPLAKINAIVFTKDFEQAIVWSERPYSSEGYFFKFDNTTKSWDYELFYELLE